MAQLRQPLLEEGLASAYPLKVQFHHRYTANGFKVDLDMPKTAVEPSRVIDFRKLVIDAEADVERVVALRPYLLKAHIHHRNAADGFKVD